MQGLEIRFVGLVGIVVRRAPDAQPDTASPWEVAWEAPDAYGHGRSAAGATVERCADAVAAAVARDARALALDAFGRAPSAFYAPESQRLRRPGRGADPWDHNGERLGEALLAALAWPEAPGVARHRDPGQVVAPPLRAPWAPLAPASNDSIVVAAELGGGAEWLAALGDRAGAGPLLASAIEARLAYGRTLTNGHPSEDMMAAYQAAIAQDTEALPERWADRTLQRWWVKGRAAAGSPAPAPAPAACALRAAILLPLRGAWDPKGYEAEVARALVCAAQVRALVEGTNAASTLARERSEWEQDVAAWRPPPGASRGTLLAYLRGRP